MGIRELDDGELDELYLRFASSSGDGTSSGTFTCEAGYDALAWEAYAGVPD